MRFVDNYGGMACSKQRYEHGATLEGDGCSGNYFEERGGDHVDVEPWKNIF